MLNRKEFRQKIAGLASRNQIQNLEGVWGMFGEGQEQNTWNSVEVKDEVGEVGRDQTTQGLECHTTGLGGQ